MKNIERWVRTTDGAYPSQPITSFVDVTSQRHLCVVQGEEDNATNLQEGKKKNYELRVS